MSTSEGTERNQLFLEYCRGGSYEDIQRLIQGGFDMNARISEVSNPFMMACKDRSVPYEVIKFLLEHGAKTKFTIQVSLFKKNVTPPLDVAYEVGNAGALRALLEHDAAKNENEREYTVEQLRSFYAMAINYDKEFAITTSLFAHARQIGKSAELIDSLARHSLEGLFLKACKEGSTIKLEQLIGAGLDLNAVNDSRWSPFTLACRDPSTPTTLIKFMLEQGANPKPKVRNTEGIPLDIARRQGNFELVKVLLEHDAGKDPRDYPDEDLKTRYELTFMNDDAKDKQFREILLDHAKKMGKADLMPDANLGYIQAIRRKEVFDSPHHLPRGKLKQKLIGHIVRELQKNHSKLSTAQALTQPVSLEGVKFTRLERLLLGKKANQPWTLAAALNVHRHLLHRNLTQSYKHWMHESMHDAKTTQKDKVILFLQMTVDRMKSETFHRQSGKEFALTTLLEDLKADKSQMTLRDLCEFRGTGPDPLLRVLLSHRTGRDEALNSGLEFDAEAFRQLDQPKSYQEFSKEFDLESKLGEQVICDILNAGEKPALNHK